MANSVIRTPNRVITKSYDLRNIPVTYLTGGGVYRVNSDGYSIGKSGYQVVGITLSEPWGNIHSVITPYIQNVTPESETVNFISDTSQTIEGLTVMVIYRIID